MWWWHLEQAIFGRSIYDFESNNIITLEFFSDQYEVLILIQDKGNLTMAQKTSIFYISLSILPFLVHSPFIKWRAKYAMPECQFDNRQGVQFCEECGTKLELKCPNCKTIIPLDRKFCGKCGSVLKKFTESANLKESNTDTQAPQLPAEKTIIVRVQPMANESTLQCFSQT